MRGVTKAGKPWKGMESAGLASRVRAMCRFDIEKMEPLINASDKQRAKKERERTLRRRKDQDELIPDELRNGMKRTAKYGDNPNVFMSSQEEANWKRFIKDTLRDYPHLNSTTSMKLLEQLADLMMMADRHRQAFLAGHKLDYEDKMNVAQQTEKMMKVLGIHPDQLIRRVTEKKDTTIGAAALRMSQVGDYRQLRARFWVEEMLMIYAMYMRPTADGLQYQLDDIGLYGMTKTRVVHCPKCQTKNWAGISIEEIEQWLVQNGHLKKMGEGYPTYQPGTPNVSDSVIINPEDPDAGPESTPESS